MKRTAAWLLCLGLTASALRAAEPVIPPDAWENPQVFGVNKLPARSSLWPHPSAASALASPGSLARSPWVQKISGEWKFHWANHPGKRPAGFERPEFDDAAWKTITVPSCVELLGYGTPLYVNSTYPFKVDPPRVMGEPPKDWTFYKDRNPASSFRRWVDVPAAWTAQRVYLHVGAAGACLTAWVNGKAAGYSEDSRLPAEFDVTEAVKAGRNLVALQVLRHSDGSYLEDQDIWRLSGIFRDVYLYTRPAVHLADVAIEPELDAACRDATVRLRCQVRNDGVSSAGTLALRVKLIDPQGAAVAAFAIDAPVESAVAAGQEVEILSKAVTLAAPQKWSHETPYLYTAAVELLQDGKVLEAVAMRIGFRKVALVDKQFTLNGVPLKIRGVNRHDWHPVSGYVIDEATMRDDIRRIKQANLNAVRTSHYPDDPRFYELCDELGLLVLDEANMESHGLSYHKCVLPGDKPQWQAASVERMRRMVLRDRNHPCVVMWSLGNEAGYGKAFEAMAAEARRLDGQKRPLQYADMNAPCDVDSQTYPTPEWLVDHVHGRAVRKGEHNETANRRQHGPYPSGKPFLMNEFAWCGGNNLGNHQDYWDVIEAHPMLIGGFIWDWADKGLATDIVGGVNRPHLAAGQPGQPPAFYAYGGDYGDKPTDGTFVLNGLLESDRKPKPAYFEVARINRPIRVKAVDLASGRIRIENRCAFLDLSNFVPTWEWTADGVVVASGTITGLACPAGKSVEVTVPSPPVKTTGQRHLKVHFPLAKTPPWADAGFIVAWDQLALDEKPDLRASMPESGFVAIEQTDKEIRLSGRSFEAIIGKQNGMIERLQYGKTDVLAKPMRLTFWRPPVTNDRGWKMPTVLWAWREAGQNAKATEITAKQTASGSTVVMATIAIANGNSAVITYTIEAAGKILVKGSVKTAAAKEKDIPRIGLEAGINPALHQVEWLGLGPGETYPDRKEAGYVGLFQADALTWNHNYQPPQETGHRSEVRYARITDPATGAGLCVRGAGTTFGMNLWPWTAADLENTSHTRLLKSRDFLTLTLDWGQMGLGGVCGWGNGARPLEKYRLKSGVYDFAVQLEPLASNSRK